jgi:hypothetical protein
MADPHPCYPTLISLVSRRTRWFKVSVTKDSARRFMGTTSGPGPHLTISSREPCVVRHRPYVPSRLRRLLTGTHPGWKIRARLLDEGKAQPVFNFSEPTAGRFSLLISPRPEWRLALNARDDGFCVRPVSGISKAT